MDLNRFQFTGNLTKDAELSSSEGERARGRLRLAVNSAWTDAQQQRQERAHFHTITLWGKEAENAAEYLGKGSQIYVEGRLESSEYEKNGQRVYSTDLIATFIKYLDTRKPGDNHG